jgi:hypothetical protein
VLCAVSKTAEAIAGRQPAAAIASAIIAHKFGAEVASIVLEVTDDKGTAQGKSRLLQPRLCFRHRDRIWGSDGDHNEALLHRQCDDDGQPREPRELRRTDGRLAHARRATCFRCAELSG